MHIKIDKNSNSYFIFAQGGKGCQYVLFGGGWSVFFGGGGGALFGGVVRGVRVLQSAHFGILAFWHFEQYGRGGKKYRTTPPRRRPARLGDACTPRNKGGGVEKFDWV